MENNWLTLLQDSDLTSSIMDTNQLTSRYGLTLDRQDAELILSARRDTLRREKRVETGPGIIEKIIYEFCDSDYISQSEYTDTLIRLQEIFFMYKNELRDMVSDDVLLHFMKEKFETVCAGDIDYLESTCLDEFARAVRAGTPKEEALRL